MYIVGAANAISNAGATAIPLPWSIIVVVAICDPSTLRRS